MENALTRRLGAMSLAHDVSDPCICTACRRRDDVRAVWERTRSVEECAIACGISLGVAHEAILEITQSMAYGASVSVPQRPY